MKSIVLSRIATLMVLLCLPAMAVCDEVPLGCQSFHVASGTFRVWDRPKQVEDTSFTDHQGRTFRLSAFKGRPVLLHVWGTWCPPCLLEMPSLSRLAVSIPNEDLLVLPVSRDSGGATQVMEFYRKHEIKGLPVAVDRWGKLAYAMSVNKVPETIYLDRNLREVGRLTGMLDWDAPNVRAHLRACLLR